MLGNNPIFTWTSKNAQKKEAEAYEKWAFPHGKEQRKGLETLLAELFPKEQPSNTLIAFLTCKELFEQIMESKGLDENATVDNMLNELKKYKLIIRKKEMPLYIAVVLADRRFDSELKYRTADEVRAKMLELELLREN